MFDQTQVDYDNDLYTDVSYVVLLILFCTGAVNIVYIVIMDMNV